MGRHASALRLAGDQADLGQLQPPQQVQHLDHAGVLHLRITAHDHRESGVVARSVRRRSSSSAIVTG